MILRDVTIIYLYSLSMHIGHSWKNTIFNNAWLILLLRRGLAIINLLKTILMLRASLLIVGSIISAGAPIWFINLEEIFDRFVKFSAKSCGEFFTTKSWVRGAISNFNSVFNSYKKLSNLTEILISDKQDFFIKSNKSLNFMSNWHLTRFTWPRLLYLTNLVDSYAPAREAISLKIPTIAIIDTNVWSQITPLPIPGNDESVDCVIFYNDVMCEYVLFRKFVKVALWFFNVKSGSRVMTFVDWLSNSVEKKVKIIDKPRLSNLAKSFFDSSKNFSLGLKLFFSFDFWKGLYKEDLDVFYADLSDYKLENLYFNFSLLRANFLCYLSIYFFKRLWHGHRFFFNNFLTPLNFKLTFVKRSFLRRKFHLNFYIKKRFKDISFRNNMFLNLLVYFFFLNKYLPHFFFLKFSVVDFDYFLLVNNFLMTSYVNFKKLWSTFKFFPSRFIVKYRSFYLPYFLRAWRLKRVKKNSPSPVKFSISSILPFSLRLKVFFFDFSLESYIGGTSWQTRYLARLLVRLKDRLFRRFFSMAFIKFWYSFKFISPKINARPPFFNWRWL